MSINGASLGWPGTGRMGAALARRLIEAGQRVTVRNRTPAKAEPLVAAGARAAGRITGLAACDVVFIIVSAPPYLEQVVAALLSGESRPGVLVDWSTVSARVRAEANEAGAAFLEFLNGTVVSPDWLRKRAGDLVARDWTPTFTTELLRKELRHEDFLSLYDQQARVAGLVPEPEG
jgi:NAD(P)-dependent dehydrogenase (short-subunit alcohol dehydrogenase family)